LLWIFCIVPGFLYSVWFVFGSFRKWMCFRPLFPLEAHSSLLLLWLFLFHTGPFYLLRDVLCFFLPLSCRYVFFFKQFFFGLMLAGTLFWVLCVTGPAVCLPNFLSFLCGFVVFPPPEQFARFCGVTSCPSQLGVFGLHLFKELKDSFLPSVSLFFTPAGVYRLVSPFWFPSLYVGDPLATRSCYCCTCAGCSLFPLECSPHPLCKSRAYPNLPSLCV